MKASPISDVFVGEGRFKLNNPKYDFGDGSIVTSGPALAKLLKRQLRLRPKLEGRVCFTCGAEVPPRTGWKNRRRFCKTCRGDERRRNFHLIRFGLTAEMFQNLKDKCGNCCMICGIPAPTIVMKNGVVRRELCIDHDHVTGKVRGLLCTSCNRALGFIDKPGWLEKAQTYLNQGVAGV